MREFPMQHGPAISWETAETVYRAYSKLYGTRQSLERLAARGGFGWAEVEVIFRELAHDHPEKFKEIIGREPSPTERTRR